MGRLLYILPLLLLPLLLVSCGDAAYLLQCARGQWDLLSRARPIDELIRTKELTPAVRAQLQQVVTLRGFAVESLHLPDSGSYRDYADIGRPYAVWNLVVAPELSLELQQWCFPIAGCVTYRGYFEEESARRLAESFSSQGYDVDVYGVQAYSTLNWFDDPVLNTFLTGDELRMASLLFHEMAHQVVYVKGDTAFNEAFAKTVEREGLRRWLATRSPGLWQQYLLRETRAADFNRFLERTRAELRSCYDSARSDELKRAAKQEILRQAVREYDGLKAGWQGFDGFDAWMKRGLNNARLASIATYHDLVPAFEALLAQGGGDLERFYAEVRRLGTMTDPERHARLKTLVPPAQAVLAGKPAEAKR